MKRIGKNKMMFSLAMIVAGILFYSTAAYASLEKCEQDIDVPRGGTGVKAGFNGINGKIYKLAVSGGYQSVMSIVSLDEKGRLIKDSVINVKQGHNQSAIVLDPLHQKMYVAIEGGMITWSLDNEGNLLPGTYKYCKDQARSACMALNPAANRLYVAYNREDAQNLSVFDLDDGNVPKSDDEGPRSYQAGLNTAALIFDARRGVLYVGNNTAAPNLYVYHLDKDGEPEGKPAPYSAGEKTNSLALDSVRNKLYVASSDLFIYSLDDRGMPVGEPKKLGLGPKETPSAVLLDSLNSVLYFMRGQVLCELPLDEKGNPKGDCVSHETFGVFNSIFLDEALSRLYVYQYPAGLAACNRTEPKACFLRVNSGGKDAADINVTLDLQATNPHWVCVSGDLQSIGAPVSKLNEWVSVDGNAWSNDGGKTRAKVLRIPAVLKPGPGKKQIRVMYRESSSRDYDGVVQGATVTIELK